MAKTDLIVRIIGDVSKLKGDLAKANKSLNSFKSVALKAGTALGVAFGGREVLRAIGAGIMKVAEFEEQMSKVGAISGASAKDIKMLTQNALDLGRKSKFTATQIGSMQETLARLGFTARHITNTTEAVRKLATAAGEELAPAAEIMAGSMKSFNIESAQSERVANVMASSFANTSLNLEKYGAAMSNVGAISRVAGKSLEFTTAAVGTLTDRNIDASKAGTDLRKIFIELNNKGLSYEQAMLKVRTSTDKLGVATELFGVRAAASGVILAENEQKVNELTEGYKNNGDELDRMVAIMEDNLITDMKLFESALDGTIQKGGVFSDTIREIVQNGTTLISQLNDLADGEGSHLGKVGLEYLKAATGANLFLGVNKLLSKNTDSYNNKLEEQEKDLKKVKEATDNLIDSMFNGGDPNRFLAALGMTDHEASLRGYMAEFIMLAETGADKEEVRERILERQKIIADEIAQIEKDRLAAVNALIAAKSKELKLSEGMHTLSSKGASLASNEFLDKGSLSTGFEGVQDAFLARQAKFNEDALAMAEETKRIAAEIGNGIGAVMQGFGAALAAGENPLKAAGQQILGIIGDLIGQLGKAMIGSGIAMVAAKLAFSNPITSGAGLIAAGTALTLLSGAIGTFASGMTSGGSSGFSGSSGQEVRNVNAGQQAVDVNVNGVIHGRDLLLVAEKNQKYNLRTGG